MWLLCEEVPEGCWVCCTLPGLPCYTAGALNVSIHQCSRSVDSSFKLVCKSCMCEMKLHLLIVKCWMIMKHLSNFFWPFPQCCLQSLTDLNFLDMTAFLSFLHFNTAGWRLCTATAFMGGTVDNVLPCCVSTTFCVLLPIWDGGEVWWYYSTWNQS